MAIFKSLCKPVSGVVHRLRHSQQSVVVMAALTKKKPISRDSIDDARLAAIYVETASIFVYDVGKHTYRVLKAVQGMH